MREVPDVSDASMIFGGIQHMPKPEEIPPEFKNHNTQNKWVKLMNHWFYEGLPKGTEFIPKPGVDGTKAVRAIRAILGSFEPKHQHKEAAVAYLLSEWFDDVKLPEGRGD